MRFALRETKSAICFLFEKSQKTYQFQPKSLRSLKNNLINIIVNIISRIVFNSLLTRR